MRKKERHQKIVDLIRIKRISSQHELHVELEAIGIAANQASISRDLNELGVFKVKGTYSLPQMRSRNSSDSDFVEFDTAGDHLLVVRTSPGKANAVAITIDDMKLGEIVGTLAGDDSIFIATKGSAQQKLVIQKIMAHLKR